MADNKFALKVMCPDRTFLKAKRTWWMNTTEGYIGVYPGHIPIATVLAPGILVIHNDGELKRAALHSGFARISPDNIMILAEVAEWPDEIDLNRAEEARVRAERRLSGTESGIDIKRAEAALKRSLTRISIKG